MDTKLFNVQAFTLGFRTSFLQNEDFSDPNKTIDYSVLFSIGF
jgi:hypothetical protein